MKDDKYKSMTDRQARQLDRLGVKYDRKMTVYEANNLANTALQKAAYRECEDVGEKKEQ